VDAAGFRKGYVEYRNLGHSGLKVSLVGLGCNQIGGKVDIATTEAIVNKCVDVGITFFDTADMYSGGKSEQYLAPALKPHRRNIVVATKSANPMAEGPYWGGASRKYLMDAVDDCLRRLDTDYIDLYQMHRWDAATPIEETLRALEDMVRSGKVRYIGNSNYAGWQVATAAAAAKAEHLEPFVSAQNQYNLLQRDIERELIPACAASGVGIIPFSPLSGGFLTGKYRPGEPPPEGARLSGGAMASRILTDKNYESLGRLEKFAEERGHTMTELAMSWLAAQPLVGSVISGATRPEQVEENARAVEWKLSTDDLAEIDSIMGVTPPGGPMGGPPRR